MQAWVWILVAAGVAALLFFTVAYFCFFKVFYSTSKQKRGNGEEYPIPDGHIYEAFRPRMIKWLDMARSLPYRACSIVSHDGLTLRGKYYECKPGATIELLMHGYRGNAERDMSGAIERCFRLGHNALLIDQRAAGASDGHVITFGINESRDCLRWVEYIHNEIDEKAPIIIAGVSMGAATVMIAAGDENLPSYVVGALADCGYSSARDIIQKVMAEHHYPVKLTYFFARLGGKLFGHFDVEERVPIEQVKKARVPIIFLHGDDDDFVPLQMSIDCHAVCSTKKHLTVIPGAGHGLAFPVDEDGYLAEVGKFFGME